MNIEHIGMYATDSAVLADWYMEVLGLRVVNRIEKAGRPPVVFLQGASGAIIEILPTEIARNERELTCPGFTHLGLVVADFEGDRKRLEARGVEMWGVRKTSNGWTIGYLRDPEGNILELVQR